LERTRRTTKGNHFECWTYYWVRSLQTSRANLVFLAYSDGQCLEGHYRNSPLLCHRRSHIFAHSLRGIGDNIRLYIVCRAYNWRSQTPISFCMSPGVKGKSKLNDGYELSRVVETRMDYLRVEDFHRIGCKQKGPTAGVSRSPLVRIAPVPHRLQVLPGAWNRNQRSFQCGTPAQKAYSKASSGG